MSNSELRSDEVDPMVRTRCANGPWIGRNIEHRFDDHEDRIVTHRYESNLHGAPKQQILGGCYRWSGGLWWFYEGLPPVRSTAKS